jgi:hypothetical protein
MTDKYYFLGGEDHLRLVLGAHGFWDSRWHYGFSFYSPKRERYIHAKFSKSEYINARECVEVEFKYQGMRRPVRVYFSKNPKNNNVYIWQLHTDTRLDLL